MYVKSHFMIWMPLLMLLSGLFLGFYPPVAVPVAAWPFTPIFFVLALLWTLLVWYVGMQRSEGGVLGLVFAIFPVLTLRTAMEDETPALLALQLSFGSMAICGVAFLLMYGLGYGTRPVEKKVGLQHTSHRF